MPDDKGARLTFEPGPGECDEAAVAMLLSVEVCIWGPLLCIAYFVVAVGVGEYVFGAVWLAEETRVVGVGFGTRVGSWHVPFFYLKVM